MAKSYQNLTNLFSTEGRWLMQNEYNIRLNTYKISVRASNYVQSVCIFTAVAGFVSNMYAQSSDLLMDLYPTFTHGEVIFHRLLVSRTSFWVLICTSLEQTN